MINSLVPTASTSIYFLKLFVFFFLFIFPFGKAILHIAQVDLKSCLSNFVLAMVTGVLFSNSFYFVMRWNHQDKIIPYGVAILFCFSIFFMLKKRKEFYHEITNKKIYAYLFFLILFGTLYHFQKPFHAIYWAEDGSLVLSRGYYADPIWKLSVASELEHSVPPQMPLFAGQRLTYHYFMELFTVFVHDLTGVDLVNLRVFFVPLLSYVLVNLAIFEFFKKTFNSFHLALAAVFFTLIAGRTSEDSHIFFTITLFLSTLMMMGYFLSNFAKKTHWVLMSIILGHSMMYESVISFLFLGGMGIASIIYLLWFKNWKPFLYVGIGGILALCYQKIAIGRLGGGAGEELVKINFPFLQQAMKDFIPCKEALKWIILQKSKGLSLTSGLILIKLIQVPFLASIGFLKKILEYFEFAIFSLPLLWRQTKNLKEQNVYNFFLVPILIFGIIFPMFFSFSFLWEASFRILAMTIFLLNAFLAYSLWIYWQQSYLRKASVLIGGICLFLWPNYQRFHRLQKTWTQYSLVPKEDMEIFNFLRTQTPPDSILMHNFMDHDVLDSKKGGERVWVFKDHYYYGSALGGRRVVLEGSKKGIIRESSKFGFDRVNQVMADINQVYETSSPESAFQILSDYHVNYLWVLRSNPLRYSSANFIRPTLENEKNILYEFIASPKTN